MVYALTIVLVLATVTSGLFMQMFSKYFGPYKILESCFQAAWPAAGQVRQEQLASLVCQVWTSLRCRCLAMSHSTATVRMCTIIRSAHIVIWEIRFDQLSLCMPICLSAWKESICLPQMSVNFCWQMLMDVKADIDSDRATPNPCNPLKDGDDFDSNC